MKRVSMLITSIVLLAVTTACSRQPPGVAESERQARTPATPTPPRAAVREPSATPDFANFARDISAIGEVKANQEAELFFTVSGTVAEVHVAEGDAVAQGALLAILDTRPFDQNTQQAEASLADALARQAALTEPPKAYDVNAAQARVSEAQAALAELQAGAKEQDIETARSNLEQARINLQAQRDTLSANKTNAGLQIEQIANEIRNLQDQYSQIYWDNRELEDALRGEELPQENKNREEAALRAVETAEQRLEQAKLAYEEAQKAEMSGIQQAEQQVIQAEQALEKLLLPPDPDDRAAAEAAVAQAQANLDRLFPNPTAAELDQAAAAVARAQAQLDTARLNRSYAELYAPFAGVVSVVNIDPGDPSGPGGQPVIELVDTSTLYVEASISDVDIVNVSPGQAAEVYVEALPGQVLSGEVSYIAPSATIVGTVRTYEVRIALDTYGQLQDGMSVRVVLKTGANQ